uniref:Uncharacterized protein n=1 Tax=Aegilops tauschii TaxID=37682 RepID=M8BUG9_AEGTA
MKRRRDVIKVPTRWSPRRYDWQLIQVFELDELTDGNTQLVPVEDVGRDRAVFVGEVACFSASTRTFPCVAGNAVYPGAAGVCCPPVGVRYLADKTMDPPFQFTTDNETLPRVLIEGKPLKVCRRGRPDVNLVPVARPPSKSTSAVARVSRVASKTNLHPQFHIERFEQRKWKRCVVQWCSRDGSHASRREGDICSISFPRASLADPVYR